MGSLQGVRAIVTGAASGIGRAVITRYLAEGASVVAVIRREEDRIDPGTNDLVFLAGDVSLYQTSARAVALAEERFGGVDVFVANAGLWDFHKKLEKQTPGEIESAAAQIFGVNVMGALFGARAAVGALRHSKGSFIVTGSNSCFRAGGGGCLYTASKFALHGVVLQLAKELAPDIRVNGVAPGATDTGLTGPEALHQNDRSLNGDAERMAAMASHIPLGFVAKPEDHVGAYVLLASRDGSRYMTGSMIVSDGGLIAGV